MHKYLYREFLASLLVITHSVLLVAPLYAATPCALSFQMVPSPATVQPNGTITYAVTVTNTGKRICSDVSISLFYADNESFVTSTPAPRASDYYWYVGSLSPNKSYKLSVTTRATSGTRIVSEGCAAARNGSDACASSTVAIRKGSSSAPSTASSSTSLVVESPVATTSSAVPAPALRENGIWVWNFPSEMNTSRGDSQMKSLASYGFNAVYITIDDYLDIAAMADGAAKSAAKAAYFSQLATFVQKAHALGMQVDAEGGANNWAISTNRWKGFALIDAVKEYNALYPNAALRGFQYDVEPHTLPDYETNKAVRLKEYVQFIDQSVTRLLGTDIRFSAVIPHFYDDAQAWTPAIAYDGRTEHTFNHLLDILEKKPGSTLLIMSYRDFFEGQNGTREISEVELKEASAGYATNIIVSQETGNVQPDYVTLYGSTKQAVFDMLGTITGAFGTYERYGGTATHYMDSFLVMK